jgi:hypothetical protein
MKRRLLALGAALALAGCSAPLFATPDPQEVRISKEQAISAVMAFVPDGSDFTVDGPREGRFHKMFVVQGHPEFIAQVDAFDGRVIVLERTDLDPALMPGPVATVLTSDEAVAAASAFLSARHVSLAGQPKVELQSIGNVSQYQVVWQSFAGDVRLPDARFVSLDPSNGAVFAFADQSRPYLQPPAPKVGRDEAIRLALDETTAPSPAVDGAQLAIDFDDDGTQLLVWEIALNSGEIYVLLHVDALTGHVTFVSAG